MTPEKRLRSRQMPRARNARIAMKDARRHRDSMLKRRAEIKKVKKIVRKRRQTKRMVNLCHGFDNPAKGMVNLCHGFEKPSTSERKQF